MKQSELEALPVAKGVMFGSELVWDEDGEKWWIGLIDGVPHRRPFGPQFSVAEFEVSSGAEKASVRIPFSGVASDRLKRAAMSWGAKHFGCDEIDLEVTASS